ncbi:hypothetical protein Nizo2776_2979 [Lactiplantibacillus plantarum]|nr:hypothetical protein Nizo2776_2979 [Lactiplantibacillus plantarum]
MSQHVNRFYDCFFIVFAIKNDRIGSQFFTCTCIRSLQTAWLQCNYGNHNHYNTNNNADDTFLRNCHLLPPLLYILIYLHDDHSSFHFLLIPGNSSKTLFKFHILSLSQSRRPIPALINEHDWAAISKRKEIGNMVRQWRPGPIVVVNRDNVVFMCALTTGVPRQSKPVVP